MAAQDFDRELTDRGMRDATATGRWLADCLDQHSLPAPGHAWVSPATRTRLTWALLAEGAGWAPEIATNEHALYAGEYAGVLDVLTATPADVATLVVVGHNPLMAQLGQLLQEGDGDPEAEAALAREFPPGSAAVFVSDDYDAGWSASFGGRLVAFHRPASVLE